MRPLKNSFERDMNNEVRKLCTQRPILNPDCWTALCLRPRPITFWKNSTARLASLLWVESISFSLVSWNERFGAVTLGAWHGEGGVWRFAFLIAPSQTNCCPLVEGFRRPSLRSGLLKPSTKGQFHPPHHLSPFELAAVPFCSRPDINLAKMK
jgi:hypothetical protein